MGTKAIFELLNRDNHFILVVMTNEPFNLSLIMDWINSIGLDVKNHKQFQKGNNDVDIFNATESLLIQDNQNSQNPIHMFVIEKYESHANFSADQFQTFKKDSEELLNLLSQGKIISDPLLRLYTDASLTPRQIRILLALSAYICQVWVQFSSDYVKCVLVKYSKCTHLLSKLFEYRFNPAAQTNYQHIVQDIHQNIEQFILNVASESEEKVLVCLYSAIKSCVRTNAYQKDKEGIDKDYISFKFKPSMLPDIVLPIPFAEIFIFGKGFSAIHLRGGKISRGGFRWSDRDDFRLEVLGLMKAQMTKNAVVVPTGAKGGFKINDDIEGLNTWEEKQQFAITCYKKFLRGILDITDNVVEGQITPPPNVVIYDEDDPYIVAAADKGTATFSDYANEISMEYNFWLGDAFASGGKTGYDHKKMGITSKGAFISAKRHCESLGINPYKDVFTVMGIGDMSGDVFGNGLTMTNKIKLVAAFNHKHIFIDPNPDPENSYIERMRLFRLPRSNWSDYDTKVLSKGGKIFDRSSKILTLTPEIAQLFNLIPNQSTNFTKSHTKDDITNQNLISITSNALIKMILTLPVDMIWNGGIGTYIKASCENNTDVRDKVNDMLRCDASDIKAKMIIEGGNLGVTQLGRVEYQKCGGKINTDFIDNSGGVDCSDREVNIKIALSEALRNNDISLLDRNKLLHDMQDEVENLVLQDNYKQTLALTIMDQAINYTTGMFSDFADRLEIVGLLDKKSEFFPSSKELKRRIASGEKLTRPELAVILSYGKMYLYNRLISTTLVDLKYCEKFLFEYFPKEMHSKYRQYILNHNLRKEIIATVLTNEMVNYIGAALIYSIQNETGALVCDIARAYLVASDMFAIAPLFHAIDIMEVSMQIKMYCFQDIIKLLRRSICWIVNNHESGSIDIMETLAIYSGKIDIILHNSSKYFSDQIKTRIEHKSTLYTTANVPQSIADKVANFDLAISVLDIISISRETQTDEETTAKIYFSVATELSLDWLRKQCDCLMTDAYWQRLSMQIIKEGLYAKQKKLVTQLLVIKHETTMNEHWIKYVEIFMNYIHYMKSCERIDTSLIIFADKKLSNVIKKII